MGEIDKYFPIKNRDGEPQYREYQRDTVVKALKAFDNGKKFVAIDGPVGSGKSVINYTIARCVGPTVYLTPQKQLQDQIMAEGWKNVRMIKGKATYLCNFCSDDTHNISCDYRGEEFNMCNNSKTGYKKSAMDEELIKANIRNTLSGYSDSDRQRRIRTSFEYKDDLDKLFTRIKDYIIVKDEELGIKINYPIQTTVGCSMAPIECSVRSSKMLAKIDNVRILNPDVFFHIMNNSPDYFDNIELLVIDECHTIENVIQRIFRVKIPLDTIKTIAGLDLFDLYTCKKVTEFIDIFEKKYKEEIGPFLVIAQIFNTMGDVPRAYSHESMCRIKSQNEFAGQLALSKSAVESMKQDFSIIHLANLAFSGKAEGWFEHTPGYKHFKGFVELIKKKFCEECEKIECNKHFDLTKTVLPACKEYARIVHNTESYRDERSITTHIIEIGEALGVIINTVNSLIKVGKEKKSFVFDKAEHDDARPICRGTKFEFFANKFYGPIKMKERYIEVVPVWIGKLLNHFFFKYANKILLSTGTWTDLKGMFKTYGIKEDEVEYIKIPSTFPVERRKVYILDNSSYTNFSSKSNGVIYDYKSKEGIKKFAGEISDTVRSIRDFINRNTGVIPNIIIHTHTFYIARALAEFGYGIDESFMIHLAMNDIPVTNSNNKFVTVYRHKDELVEILKKNPDSGLVLASASVSEGMDFKYGVARAQIILKRPTPYMGDPYVIAKFYGNEEVGIIADKGFLDRVCLTEMIQQYGRIVRAKDDWGFTFILDQAIAVDFKNMLGRYGKYRLGKLNIQYFLKGIQTLSDQYGRVVFKWPFSGMIK